jgi:hypothetical protein
MRAPVARAAASTPACRDGNSSGQRWYGGLSELGAGDGAALASCLLATLRAEDGDADADAEHALQAIHTAALIADEHVQTLALDALAAVRR